MTHAHGSPSRRSRRGRGRRGVVRNVPLRTHWLLLTVLAITLCAALLIQGYTQHMFGIGDDAAAAGGGPAGSVPAAVEPRRAGDRRAGRGRPAPLVPGRTPSPSPSTTARTRPGRPRILDVLRRHHVHATFFVVGTAGRGPPGPGAAHPRRRQRDRHPHLHPRQPRRRYPAGSGHSNCARPSSPWPAPPGAPVRCCARRTPPATTPSTTRTGTAIRAGRAPTAI